MRTIHIDSTGELLKEMLLNPDPVDEDIIVKNNDGDVLGAFITEEAYEFFLKKIEEEEDRIDHQTVEEFHKTRE